MAYMDSINVWGDHTHRSQVNMFIADTLLHKRKEKKLSPSSHSTCRQRQDDQWLQPTLILSMQLK